MRSSVFQYPYSKIFRRTEDALSVLGLKIISSDGATGNITAITGFSLNKPVMRIKLFVEELENHNTRVTITGSTSKNLFFQKKRDAETDESKILEKISAML
jgi:hypothetical protein